LQSSQNHVESGIATLRQSITNLVDHLHQVTDSAESACSTFSDAISSSHLPQIGHTFSELTDYLHTQFSSPFQEHVDSLHRDLAGLLEDFDKDLHSMGEQFRHEVEESAGNLKQYAEHDIQHSIGEAMDDLVKDAISNFAAELVESIAMSDLGA